MRFLPKANPLYEKISTTKLVIPEDRKSVV